MELSIVSPRWGALIKNSRKCLRVSVALQREGVYVTKLVYYEEYQYIDKAIAREKQLTNWHRE